MSTITPLEHAILRTLAYYDTHDFPLTPEEVWRWLYPAPGEKLGAVSVADVKQALMHEAVTSRTEWAGPYVVLKGRGALQQTRAERFVANQKKWERAKTTARYLEVVPFIKMVALVNTVALRNGKPESDVDLLIVASPGHIWIARMTVTFIVSMLGYRRGGGRETKNIKDKICLSFYLTTLSLNLEPLKAEEPDTHFMFWASQAVPLLNTGGTYEKYMAANGWITQHMPHAFEWDWKAELVPRNSGFRSIKHTYEAFFHSPIGAWIEGLSRTQQMKRFSKDTESKSHLPTNDVVINEDVLKFHEADRRVEYNRKFQDRLKSIGI